MTSAKLGSIGYVRSRERSGLTPCELKVLQALQQGLSLKQLGYDTGKARTTVSQQMRSLMRQAGCKNVFQLGVWARDNGYAKPLNSAVPNDQSRESRRDASNPAAHNTSNARADAVAREAEGRI